MVQVSAATPSQLQSSRNVHDLITCPRKTQGKRQDSLKPAGLVMEGPEHTVASRPRQEPAAGSGQGSFSNTESDPPCPEHLSRLIPQILSELLPVTIKTGRRQIIISHIPMSLVTPKERKKQCTHMQMLCPASRSVLEPPFAIRV